MALSGLRLQPSYRSGDSNIAADFIVPCLRHALRYDRATGYFCSSAFSVILRGLADFVSRGGKIRLVASPQLTADDIQQIDQGYAARDFVIDQRLTDALNDLSRLDSGAYGRLAWLVANGHIDIRLAIPRRLRNAGIYHEKFGVFEDERDTVAFSGSLNETFAAFEANFEHIDVFASWLEPGRTAEKTSYFSQLWNRETALLDVFDFPDAHRQRLIREAPREYIEAESVSAVPDEPLRTLRRHQERAIDAWRGNNCRGLLEMATGSGKTFTALMAADSLLAAGRIKTVLVLVPYIAIADQWKDDVSEVLKIEPIVCHSQSGDWKAKLRTHVTLSRFEAEPSSTCIVALYDTAEGDEFREQAQRLPQPIMVIADEVHNITSDSANAVLLDSYDLRLGLSATPERYLDEVGTEKLYRYFNGVIYRFTLSDAISNDILTPYSYFPIICTPNDEHGASNLSGVLAAKFNRFVETFAHTPAASEGYSLIYCQWQQLEETKAWLGHQIGAAIHTFTAQEDLLQRRTLLREFGDGHLQALVAMRCLDEGVDVPPTRSAFLLASSENPKQFVQRRGRVLRKYPGKTNASIHDYVYLSKLEGKSGEDSLRKELTRFAEFALSAQNSGEATQIIVQAAEEHGIPLRDFISQGV